MLLQNTKQIAEKLLQLHNLNDYIFKFDGAKRRFGSCSIKRKIISLSKHLVLLNEESQVTDTILHEIAHALTPSSHHGIEWKKCCIHIGANPIRQYSTTEVRTPEYIWEGSCGNCGHVFKRHKRRLGGWCRSCGKEKGLIKWIKVI